MRNILILSKVMYNNKKNILNSQISKMQRLIIYFFFIISVIAMTFCSEITIYNELEKLGLKDKIIHMSILLSTFIILIISIMEIFIEFYYSNDIKNFLILPVKNIELLIAKFIIISIKPYIISILVFFSTTLIYGIINKFSFSYFLLSIIGTIVLPIIPIITVAILTMIFMRIISMNILYKFKKLGYIISLLSGIIIAFLTKILDLRNILYSYNNNNINILLRLFPDNYYLSKGLYSNINTDRYLAIFYIICICLLYFIAFYIIATKTYINVITKISESNTKDRKKNIKTHSQLVSLIIKDFRIILRNPFFFANLLIRTFIIPISLFLLIFIRNDSENFLFFIKSNTVHMFSILFIILFIESKLNLISATSISREKENFFISKITPVKTTYQIFSKIVLGYLVNLLLIIFTLFIFKLVLNIRLFVIVSMFLICMFICFYGSMSAFIRNLKVPMLDYDDNKSLISSNPNILYLYLTTIFQTIILSYCTFSFEFTLKTLFLLWFIFSVSMNILCVYRIRKVYIRLYEML